MDHSLVPVFLLGFSFDMGSSLEGLLKWETAVRWMESVLPLLQTGTTVIVCYWIAVLLPMSIFRRMRPVISGSLRVSSFLLGMVCVWRSVVVVYRLLGWLAVVVGLLLAGVGVVPMALYATASKGDWDVFGNLLTAAVLTILPRVVARLIPNHPARTDPAVRGTNYYADDYN